jgi:HlyD family secretion protein
MKRKSIIIILVLLLIIISIIAYLTIIRNKNRNSIFQFTTVMRGDIKNTITSTGILHPKSKVEVGTQISGTFASIYVDYNDVVKKGQLLAELDKKILEAALDEAKAMVLSTKEKFKFSKDEYLKKKELYESGYLSEIEFYKFQSAYYMDSAAYLSARANLDKAYTNLEYAEIASPISGTVIERNVEAGQTVAANFNTPTLFVIAEDLSKMEIHATVDESDISYIYVGQDVEFSVLAYPDSTFKGTINQIRMHPMMIQNVVNYIVVINADNDNGLLLPGMTATVDFITDLKKDVLMVSKSALNVQLPKKMVEKFHKRMRRKMELLPDSLKPEMQPPPPPGEEEHGPKLPENVRQVWYIDENGELAMEPVETGLSDDNNTEITRHLNLRPGIQVISGIIESKKKERNAVTNTNQMFGGAPQQGGGGPPPPPGGP